MIRILLLVMFAALLLTSLFVTVRQPDPASASDKIAIPSHAADRRAESSSHGVDRRIPARETRVRSGSPTRQGSLRWHSFLPGMFR